MATKLPPEPSNLLEEIICDSDLDYLGRSDFIPVSNTLFEELKGTALSVHLEAYNPKMGNYTEIKEKLSEAEKAEFEKIYGNPENYQRFWDDFRNKTMELNQTYGYSLDFTIFNYDSYFNE